MIALYLGGLVPLGDLRSSLLRGGKSRIERVLAHRIAAMSTTRKWPEVAMIARWWEERHKGCISSS